MNDIPEENQKIWVKYGDRRERAKYLGKGYARITWGFMSGYIIDISNDWWLPRKGFWK